jgi:hypothetical protein
MEVLALSRRTSDTSCAAQSIRALQAAQEIRGLRNLMGI